MDMSTVIVGAGSAGGNLAAALVIFEDRCTFHTPDAQGVMSVSDDSLRCRSNSELDRLCARAAWDDVELRKADEVVEAG